MNKLIGREYEMAELRRFEASGRAEFIAMYGRRRVGKTFLLNSMYSNDYSFSMSGTLDGTKQEQLQNFANALEEYGYEKPVLKNWIDAFESLKKLLKRCDKNRRMIVFIDELPCLDTPCSGMVRALGHFWNSWGSLQDNLMLIVCGSATSWMVKNILDNRGGLHNRITHSLHLAPFTLKETEEYLIANGMDWGRLNTVQTYMTFGGVAYYLSLLNPELSLAQNIDRLFFNPNGELRREYARLFRSLFRNPDPYMKLIECLITNKKGMTRTEIATAMNVVSAGKLTTMLDDLQHCDFIRYYNVKHKKIKTNDGLYQLVDFFTIFYLTFYQHSSSNPNYWTNNISSQKFNSWYGLAFERVCMAHIPQIKKAIGIDQIHTEYYSWYGEDLFEESEDGKPNKRKVQIDLLIERADRMINLCEIKYSAEPYLLTKEEYEKMLKRTACFKTATQCKLGIIPTMITTFGLARGKYASSIHKVVTMDDLFA